MSDTPIYIHSWHYGISVAQRSGLTHGPAYFHLFTTKETDDRRDAIKQYRAIDKAFPQPEYRVTSIRRPNYFEAADGRFINDDPTNEEDDQ